MDKKEFKCKHCNKVFTEVEYRNRHEKVSLQYIYNSMWIFKLQKVLQIQKFSIFRLDIEYAYVA